MAVAACLVIAVILLEIRLYIRVRQLKRIKNLTRLVTIRLQLGLSRTVLATTVTAFRYALERHDLSIANNLLSQFAGRLRKMLH